MKKTLIAFGLICSINVFAMGGADYNTSITGDVAQKLFAALPELKPGCRYAQAPSEDQGNFGPTINALIGDANINSIECVQKPNQPAECTASTIWDSEPCQ